MLDSWCKELPMSKISTFILTEEYSTAEVLKLYLEEFENLEICATPQNSIDLIDLISKNNNQSLLIADISQNKNEKLELISQITQLHKNCQVIALSDNPSVNLIIEIMRAGAKEFVPVPIIKNELFSSVQKLCSNADEHKKNKCKIISVFSNKGGLGKTSIATNLAYELANNTKENVALIDLNFQMGDITTFLNIQPSFNISYMLENLDKINETFLLSTLERYKKTSLYVLADPPFFKQADNISPKQISKLFETLKETFSYIIIDSEASFDGKNIAALDNSDIILLVTAASIPALRNTQRCLELFNKLGYDKNKTKIILNRYIENDEIKEEDITRVLSKEVYYKLPNNYFALISAINKGITLHESNYSTDIAQSYSNLAKAICDSLYKQNMAQKFENLLSKE